jgi:hypothetical protein
MIIVVLIRQINQEMILNDKHGMMELLFKGVLKVRSHLLIMRVHKSIFGEHREEI